MDNDRILDDFTRHPIIPGLGRGQMPAVQTVQVTRKDAVRAAKNLGLSVISVRRLEASRTLGSFIGKAGVIKIGRSMLAFAADHLHESILQCRKCLTDPNLDPEQKIKLIESEKELLDRYVAVGRSMIGSAKVDASDGAEASIPTVTFAPGQKITPVQNMQVNLNQSPTKG